MKLQSIARSINGGMRRLLPALIAVSACAELPTQPETVVEEKPASVPQPAVPPPPATPRNAVLDLAQRGANNKTYLENFTDLSEAIFKRENNLAYLQSIDGKPHLIVPWYGTSSSSNVNDLKAAPHLSAASRDQFLMVTDEFSEVCLIAAAGTNAERMQGCMNTTTKLQGSYGLPGWLAVVHGSTISLKDANPASDATARLGIAFYTAAKNEAFSTAHRAQYRTLADQLLRSHMQQEYAHTAVKSPISSRTLQHVAAGGAVQARDGLGHMDMWIGYYGDIAHFLLAGYAATGDGAVRERLHEVLEQFVIAARYDPREPQKLGMGHFNMKLAAMNGALAPTPSFDSWFWTPGKESWDTHDAPRVLNITRILELAKLAGENTTAAPYSYIQQWGAGLLANGSQSAVKSCTQYKLDGTPKQELCGLNAFNNGLSGLFLLGMQPSLVQGKIDSALQQINWNTGASWGMHVPGVYTSVRLPKLMIAAGGLDAAVYTR